MTMTTTLLETSFLYESEPMYVLEQDRFLNGVCKVSACSRSNSLQSFFPIVPNVELR